MRLGRLVVERRTLDRKVTGSSLAHSLPSTAVHMHLQHNLVRSKSVAMLYGREGNRLTLHWLCVTDFVVCSPTDSKAHERGDEHPGLRSYMDKVGGVAQCFGRRSLVGKLFLPCACVCG